jgi:hypothetical protein
LFATSGCIISSSNSDVAHVTVSWTLKQSSTNSITTCPPPYDTAALVSQQVDALGNPIGRPLIDAFPCSDGIGTSDALAPAYYNEWIVIQQGLSDLNQFARSSSSLEQDQIIDLTTSDIAYNTDIIVDGGFFHFSWGLTTTAGAPLSCAQAGSTGGVDLMSTNVSTPSLAFDDVFRTCDDGEGITDGIPTGGYTISIKALNNQGATIGEAPAFSGSIADPAAMTPVSELGTVLVPISGT